MLHVVVSGIVQYGRFGEFQQAFEEYNTARGNAGLPTYELLTHAGAGPLNEVYLVASFDDVAAADAAERTVVSDSAMLGPLARMTDNVVPGTVVEKRLAPPD